MRPGLVVVGVVLLVVGAALLFVPLIPQASQTVTYQKTSYSANLTGYSLTGSVAGSLAWNSNRTIEFLFVTCPTSTCSSGAFTLQDQNGTSGTFSFSVPSGGQIVAGILSGPPGSSATVKLTLTEPTYGSVLLVGGVLVLVVGLGLRRKPSPAPVGASPMPSAPSPQGTRGTPSEGLPRGTHERRG